jgi:hypothetical protein
MDTKIVRLDEFRSSLDALVANCCDQGVPLIVELPDRRRISIQPMSEGDDLIDDLIANDGKFQALLAASTKSGVKPFVPRHATDAVE